MLTKPSPYLNEPDHHETIGETLDSPIVKEKILQLFQKLIFVTPHTKLFEHEIFLYECSVVELRLVIRFLDEQIKKLQTEIHRGDVRHSILEAIQSLLFSQKISTLEENERSKLEYLQKIRQILMLELEPSRREETLSHILKLKYPQITIIVAEKNHFESYVQGKITVTIHINDSYNTLFAWIEGIIYENAKKTA